MLYIQEVREHWQLGSHIHKQVTGCTGCSHAILSLRQHPSLRYFLSFPSSVSLSMGCHGEPRKNTTLPLGTGRSRFLLCLPLSVYFSSYFQVSSLIVFSNSHDDLHMCLSVIMFVRVSCAYNMFWLASSDVCLIEGWYMTAESPQFGFYASTLNL